MQTLHSFSKTLYRSCSLLIILFLTSCQSDFVFEAQLKKEAAQINKKCPIMLGKGVRWDKAEALPNKVFRYTYTLTEIEQKEMDTIHIKQELTPSLVRTIKEEPSLKEFRQHGVTMIYNYKDKNGLPGYTISVTPNMYK